MSVSVDELEDLVGEMASGSAAEPRLADRVTIRGDTDD
jgi:hypothetical protein